MTRKEDKTVLDYVVSEGETPTVPGATLTFATEDIILEPLLNEINLIKNREIKSFVRALLVNAPQVFWYAPSSLDENGYTPHPLDEYGEGGMVLHTKRVVHAVMVLSSAVSLDGLEADLLLAGALLHDITKAVAVSDTRVEFDPFHPYTVDTLADYVHEIDDNQANDNSSNTLLLSELEAMTILRIIRCSHGKWSPIVETMPESPLEKFLYLADYLATNAPSIIDGDDIDTEWWQWKAQKKLTSD